jgi:hypothetical protein
MPLKWVPPEVFMTDEETGDAPVYLAYREEMFDDPYAYHYQIDYANAYRLFDIRELAALLKDVDAGHIREDHKAAIRAIVQTFGSLDEPIAILRGEKPSDWYRRLIILDRKSNDIDSDGTRTGVAHFRADGQETLCGKPLGDYQVVQRATQICFVCPECLEVGGN